MCDKERLTCMTFGEKDCHIYDSKGQLYIEKNDTDSSQRANQATKTAAGSHTNQSAKADAGKPRLSLVPMQILEDIARVREYGNMKYPEGGKDNWRNVEPERYRDAMLRHMVAYIRNPYGVDEESGLPHRWHIECNLAFLAEIEKEGRP